MLHSVPLWLFLFACAPLRSAPGKAKLHNAALYALRYRFGFASPYNTPLCKIARTSLNLFVPHKFVTTALPIALARSSLRASLGNSVYLSDLASPIRFDFDYLPLFLLIKRFFLCSWGGVVEILLYLLKTIKND